MGDDNLEQYPVHKQDAAKWPIFSNHWDDPRTPGANTNSSTASFQLPESNIYTDPNIHQYGTNGPYNQTLFLGCSVVNFGVNLGWGGDDSTCTVALIEDDAYHWNNPTVRNNNDNNIIIENTLHATTAHTIVSKGNTTFNTTPYSDQADATYNLPGSTGTVKDFLNPNVARKDPYRNILEKEQNRKNNLQQENIFLSSAIPPSPDLGKVYYRINPGDPSGVMHKLYWTYPDPGFVGESYDILGCAVRFKFHEFEFAGIVASWKKEGGQGGKRYTVELKSFSSLLSNTQLITEHYHGALFRSVDADSSVGSSAPANISSNSILTIPNIGFPSNNLGTRYGPKIKAETGSTTYGSPYKGTIKDGVPANVFNIYGYYENLRGFGRNDINDLGMKAKDILNAIEILVNETGVTDHRFSHYGRIVCRAPAITKDFALQTEAPGNVSSMRYAFLKDKYEIADPEQPFYTIFEYITHSPNGPTVTSYTRKEQRLYTMAQKGQITNSDTWPDLKLYEMGFIPSYTDEQGVYRQFFKINLTGIYDPSLQLNSQTSLSETFSQPIKNPGAVPDPPDWYRIKGPVISIMDLVQNLCNNAGHDFFVDFQPPNNIAIKTVSRKVQPTTNYIQQLLTAASETETITSYNFGKEFNKDAIPKTIYIGAKQQRLLQLHSNYLANRNTSLLFDQYGDNGNGLWIVHDLSEALNIAKIPNHNSQRNPYYAYYKNQLFNITPAMSEGTGALVWESPWPNISNWESDGCKGAGVGNYYYPIVYKGGNLTVGNQAQEPSGVVDEDTPPAISDIFLDLSVNMFGPVYKDLHDSLSIDIKEESITNPTEIATPKASMVTKNPRLYYNYPLWDEFICPYFGLDNDGTARPVYFDPSMNQIQVVCSIADLTNILGFALTQQLEVKETVVEERQSTPTPPSSQPGNNDGGGEEDPQNYNQNAPTTPSANTPAGVNQSVRDQIPDGAKRVTEWNASKRGYYINSHKFLISENEIRAAMGSLDSWLEYTFNRNFTTDLGQILRKTIFADTGKVVQETASTVPGIAKIANEGNDMPVVVVTNGPDLTIRGSVQADNPSGSKAAIASEKLKQVIDKVHQYVANIGNTYYGRQFMVKIPGATIGQDVQYSAGLALSITLPEPTGKIDVGEYKGGGKKYSNYKPATDGAWEEAGNFIDDAMVVGSTAFELFRNDDGKIGAILGYRANYEFLPATGFAKALFEKIEPVSTTPGLGSTPATFDKLDGTATNYDSIKGQHQYSIKYWRDIMMEIVQNKKTPTTPETTIGPAPSARTMALAKSSTTDQKADATNPAGWNPSIITDLPKDQYLFITYSGQYFADESFSPSFANDTNSSSDMTKTIFGYSDDLGTSDKRTIITSSGSKKIELRHKLYAKANIEPNLIFIRDNVTGNKSYNTSHTQPRAILSLDSPVLVNPTRLCDKYLFHALQIDSALFDYHGCSLPVFMTGNLGIEHKITPNQTDKVVLHGTYNSGYIPYSGGFSLGPKCIGLATDAVINSLNSSAYKSTEDKGNSMPIAPKAAMPGFAAVPLINEGSVYGPWTNHPGLIPKDIFTDVDLYFGPNGTASLQETIENLIGGVKVTVDTNLAPWNFNGMNNLDINVISTIQEDANYQLVIEQGYVEIPGAPIYKLGDLLDRSAGMLGGPIINSISANIDMGSVNTTYSFRTFNKKFGMYNKESADRLAKISQEGLSRRRQIALDMARINNETISTLTETTFNNAPKTPFMSPALADEWRSSTDLLYGFNDIQIRVPENESGVIEAQRIVDLYEYDLNWGFDPVKKLSVMSGMYNVVEYPKFISNTYLSDSRESPKKLMDNYSETSFMSLDGILSPISFYPTENFRTYHITKYPRSLCRFCQSTGKIKYKTNKSSLKETTQPQDITELSPQKIEDKKIEVSIDCPFCEADIVKAKRLLRGTSRGTSEPPFIYTTGQYSISTGVSTKLTVAGSVINYSTLNPAVLSFGEFSAFQNRQSGDYTAHCIKTIGQSVVPPYQATDSLNQAGCNSNRLFKSFMDYDQLYIDQCAIITEAAKDPGFAATAVASFASASENPHKFANNARFFGLRGPLMLHSWGYDTEGYPFPNASGEHKLKEIAGGEGQPGKTIWDYYTYIKDGEEIPTTGYVYKNQQFIESEAENIPEGKLKVTYDSKEGYFTDPIKESEFPIGWAQTPSLWPVGPIDIRWDDMAKVWTVPSRYKNSYILLEEDLVKGGIARGEIIDNNQTIENINMPLSYRKVVYIKDNIGVYGAPRGSIVYCAYDIDGGFYEPISQSVFTTSGTIQGDNSAKLYKIYKKANKALNNSSSSPDDEDQTYISNFTNPLELNITIGDIAFFTYMGDGWVVQAARG